MDWLESLAEVTGINPLEVAGGLLPEEQSTLCTHEGVVIAHGVPQVPDDVMEKLEMSQASDRLNLMALLTSPLLALVQCMEKDDVTRHENEVLSKLTQHFLGTFHVPDCSKESLGQLLTLDPVKIEPNLGLLTACLLQLDVLSKQRLLRDLTECGLECLCCLDVLKYDETPMKVRVSENVSGMLSKSSMEASASSGATPLALDSCAGKADLRSAVAAKIFAIHSKFAFLCKIPEESLSEGESPYVAFLGTTLVPLQLLETTSAACIKSALMSVMTPHPATDLFKLSARVSTSDAATGNLGAEDMIAQETSMPSVHNACRVHMIARMHTATFLELREHIQGLVNFSLSLGNSGALNQFRKSLAAVVWESKLRVHRGAPSSEVQQYRRQMLDLFGRSGTQANVKRRVTFDEQALKSKLVAGLLKAFAHKSFT
eukprot:4147278-Amphidinium_carterae.2